MLQPARQLFGRDREFAVLLRALADTEVGRARVVWIGGEPGIGKTRLAEELAAAASRRATVAWARCVDADAAPPYWPWAEVIRALLRTITREELELTVSCLERIAALVPDLVPHPATTAPPAALKTAPDRYQLFDAVRTLFQRASSRAPLVVILDDLHQADAGSLFGTCDGGLVIDLSPLRGIRVDPAKRTVRAQAGVRWGDLDRETQVFGLAVPGGVVSTTALPASRSAAAKGGYAARMG